MVFLLKGISGLLRGRFLARVVLLTLYLLFSIGTATAQSPSWPLRVSSEGAYLEDQDGVPFPIVGEAGWSAIVQLDQAQLATYLDNRQAKGFTAIIMEAIEHEFADNPPFNAFGEHPFTNGSGDWSVRNEAYWAHVNYVLNEAKARGFVVLLFPAYIGFACGNEGWCNEMQAQTDADMTDYGQWLGNRYGDQGNIIWVGGGDANANLFPNMASRVASLANGIKTNDTNHLHTAHSVRERSALDDYASFIDLNTTYSRNNPQGEIQNDYERPGGPPL